MEPDSKIEQIEAERAARKAELATQRAEQRATDLEALNALEIEHGDGAVVALDLSRFVPGLPTCAIVKAPEVNYYKRFTQKVVSASERKASKDSQVAVEEFGRACWVYPKDDAARSAMQESFPGLLASIAVAAQRLADAKAADEGKG
jgi:hypothetical protein